MRRAGVGLLLVVSILMGKEVLIAAAANTSYVLPALIAQFKKDHPKAQLKPVLASSGKLTAQIRFGAPYQLFISANLKYPQQLYREGLGVEPPKIYAYGLLAVVTRGNLPPTLSALPRARWVVIANPRLAPYGARAVEALKKSGYYSQLKPKLIYAENVAGVLNYLVTGNGDSGITAKSLLYSPKLRGVSNLHWAQLPTRYYSPIPQGVLLLKGASKTARQFYNFLFTPTARKILERFGYLPPRPATSQ